MRKQIILDCLRVARGQVFNKNHPEYGNYLHWTFIVQDGKVLGFGRNRPGRPYYDNFGYTALSKIHSEMDCWRKVKGLINSNKSFKCINIRLNKQGELRLSKPCACCVSFLDFVGCHSVIFSTEAGFGKLNIRS